MHIHILGICGTFMGGVALLARSAGFTVTGCDTGVYPPMSTQLEEQGIALIEGYSPDQLAMSPDLFVIGNAVSRGNPLLEAILDRGLPYVSGPQWLADNILQGKWVLAVAGTHGKTTTSSLLAWILEDAGLNPGFLIGGVPGNFGISARLTDTPFFVIEADEYDTAFSDKRSKFVHYRPRTVVLNNLEYDHADIFPDLAAIETQFHHLVRIVPKTGRIIVNGGEASLKRVIERGCWSEIEWFGGDGEQGSKQDGKISWQYEEMDERGDSIAFLLNGAEQAVSRLPLAGAHNRANALAAMAAARHVGVTPMHAAEALERFQGVKRRLEPRGTVRGVTVYDDFAHHPTAIATTVAGLRQRVGDRRILAVLEPRSNTMKLGTMKSQLPASLAQADAVFCYAGNLGWDANEIFAPMGNKAHVIDDLAELVDAITAYAHYGDQILVMSNGGFGGIHDRLLDALAHKA